MGMKVTGVRRMGIGLEVRSVVLCGLPFLELVVDEWKLLLPATSDEQMILCVMPENHHHSRRSSRRGLSPAEFPRLHSLHAW